MARISAVALCLLSAVSIAEAQTTVTIAQLEKILAADHAKSDKELAQQISKMELTQRLSSARAAQFQAEMPGEKSRLALLSLADASAFRELPTAEILPTAPPDRAGQRDILSRAVDFVETTVPKMPNFFATRETKRIESVRPARELTIDTLQIPSEAASGSSPDEPFRLVDSSSVAVQYIDGKEVVEIQEDKKKGAKPKGLTDWGEFGPLLGLVMADILTGKIGWLHWEQGSDGPMAVFRYKIEKDKSHYVVRYCCVPDSDPKKGSFEAVPPYHGQIAIDPKTGSVLRMVIETELDPKFPIKRDDVAVDYGPVVIGGTSYICPLKSVSITHAISFSAVVPGALAPAYRGGSRAVHVYQPPETTAINDVAFTNYHRFRAEVRIVPDSPDESTPKITPPTLAPTPPNP